MKIDSINIVSALAHGVFTVYELEGETAGNLVMVVHYGTDSKEVSHVVPVVKKRAYFCGDDEEVYDIVYSLLDNLIKSKAFACLNKVLIMCKEAPAHNKEIKRIVPAKGMVAFEGAQEVLEDAGYKFDSIELEKKAFVRDYSKLIEENEQAHDVLESNRAELKAKGATYDGLSDEIKVAMEGLAGSHIGILLIGPTGTGKSWGARILCDKLNAPYLNQQIDRGTTPDTLVGSYVPKVKSDGDEAKWEFVPGPLLKAFSEGWALILEEVNFGDPGVLAKLNEFTDGTQRVIVNGVVYKRHPNFMVFMTMNPGYEGTDILNPALKNRFSVAMIPALTEEQFCNRMVAYCNKKLSKEFFKNLFGFANRMEKQAETMHEGVKFSVRNAQRLVDCILSRPMSLAEFSSAMAAQYLNFLSLDNDNCEQVMKLEENEQIKNDIQQIYSHYGLAETKKTAETFDLSAFTHVASEEHVDSSDFDIDDLSALFGEDEDPDGDK